MEQEKKLNGAKLGVKIQEKQTGFAAKHWKNPALRVSSIVILV